MHPIALPMHQYIMQSIGKPTWTFQNIECPTIDDVMAIFRVTNFAGGVVTMPYKKTVMPFLDGIDKCAIRIGAVNNFYLTADGKLRGTNTDWLAIKGCLVELSDEGQGKPALVAGGGGAARAAIYALSVELGCKPIYIINRDEQEVAELLRDVETHGSTN